MYIPPQGTSRFDNPSHYRLLYASKQPQCAIAEAYGGLPRWFHAMLEPPRWLPSGAAAALASYELDDAQVGKVCDLDDPMRLMDLNLRPSQVITRNRVQTQRRGLAVFGRGAWIGLQWWSYYEAEWTNVALWDHSSLRVVETRKLTMSDPAVRAAARAIGRPMRSR